MSDRRIDRETAAFVCSHVFDDTSPVLLVVREEGDWMFLCGAEHPPDEEYRVVGINHLTSRDSLLCEVIDLPDNSEAERAEVGAPWIRTSLDGGIEH